MEFYYREHHEKLTTDCPPREYQQLDITAYRWVFEDGNERNFQSQYEKDMKRKNPPRRYNDITDLEKCERMALSLFLSFDSAQKQFFFLRDVQNLGKNAYVWLGKNIAMGEISLEDGVNEVPANKHGHFNHHPVDASDYSNKFKIISCFV